jgi:prolyl oligopeptidase
LKSQPPKAKRSDCRYQLGERWISDPYRWMEEDTSELREWVSAQHQYTIDQLSSLPVRESIRKRLAELMGAPATGTIVTAGKRSFFRRRLKDQEMSLLYCQALPDVAPQLLIDPSELSPDHSVTLADFHPSPDGSLIAYRLSSSGSSGMSLCVMDVDSREVLADVIPGTVNPVAHAWHTKNRVAWLPDNSGFYYTRCAETVRGGESRFHHQLYFHRLGEDWRNDELVFGESLKREQTPYPQLSSDGRYLAVVVQDMSGVSPRSEVYLLDRDGPGQDFVAVISGVGAFMSAAIHREKLYVKTNHDAPWGKIIAIDLGGEFATITVINESAHPLGAWLAVGDYLFVETIENVSSRVGVYDLSGNFVKQIQMPAIGSITALSAGSESQELLISFSSFLIPNTVYRVNLKTLELDVYYKSEVPVETEEFVVEQVWFESRDKTRIPMFLVHKKAIKRDGNNAAVVHGYGGFGVSVMPKFTAHAVPFLERGGIYAVVNTRGGGEFGEEWHRAGMRESKQNVFDDFIAAGEYLIAQGYTQAATLGCFGWSNGGLTVNAVAVQRPDLWKAVVAGAAVTDMARFHLAHGGQHWIADYGSPEDPHDLDLLMQYSPYHSLPEKLEAPAILCVAPDNDDRVATWHSYKMHAAWLAASVSQNPVLLRGEERAGHRGSPAVSRTIERYADIWSFFFWQLT